MKEAQGHSDASAQAKERSQQGQVAADRLEEAIEEERHNEIAHGGEDVDGIARDGKPAAHQQRAKDGRQKVKQIKGAGHSGAGCGDACRI
jgi:hypothetical protein